MTKSIRTRREENSHTDFDINNTVALRREIDEERKYVKERQSDALVTLRSGARLRYDETIVVGHRHLIAKVKSAAKALAMKWWPNMLDYSGVFGHIPYNFATPDHSPWGSWDFYNSRRNAIRMEKKLGKKVIEGYLRTAGFLRVAANGHFPALKKVLEKTQGNGARSPYTYFTVFQLALVLPSPGRAERLLWKVRARANAILSAHKGAWAPSWKSLAEALLITQQVGKAAIVAVAGTISGHSFKKYRDARQWLIDYHICSVVDQSDGVQSRRETHPRLSKLGVEVFRIAVPQMTKHGKQVGVEFQWLVRGSSGRTFHSSWGSCPREAIGQALKAWKLQDELTARNADLVGFLNGNAGFCPLIARQDSADAGNCSAGTESWLQARGWTGRRFIPGIWLIPHLDNGLVRNVAMVAINCHNPEQLMAA